MGFSGTPKDMGIVWETYHKGVPLLGVLGITLDKSCLFRGSIGSSWEETLFSIESIPMIGGKGGLVYSPENIANVHHFKGISSLNHQFSVDIR